MPSRTPRQTAERQRKTRKVSSRLVELARRPLTAAAAEDPKLATEREESEGSEKDWRGEGRQAGSS